jgi:hypothetical protein
MLTFGFRRKTIKELMQVVFKPVIANEFIGNCTGLPGKLVSEGVIPYQGLVFFGKISAICIKK